jgi:transcriptional regulator with PAS, ATPase and Fis domain
VAINCGALPDTLCESELFGYKAGAFTDAKKDNPAGSPWPRTEPFSWTKSAISHQPFRAVFSASLEEKVFEPLGSTKAIKTNARVITATNRNCKNWPREGQFRSDLYYRIDIVKLSLPSLFERKEDIPLLVDHFIDQFNHLTGKKIIGISRKAVAALMLHEWPGNVRELENAIEHAFVLCQEGIIRLHHLPTRVVPQIGLPLEATGLSLKDAEKHTILHAL